MDDGRHYENILEDFSPENISSCINPDGTDLHDDFRKKLALTSRYLIQRMEQSRKYWDMRDDTSLYTGLPGIAYTYFHCGRFFKDTNYISRAYELINRCGDVSGGKRSITFITGFAGFLTFKTILLYKKGAKDEYHKNISKLRAMANHVNLDRSDIPNELLYGRAGYLYCLLFLNQHISPAPFDDALIKEVIASMLHSGRMYAKSKGIPSSLMYRWHDTEYLGGAHGLAGILYMLLQARKYLTEEQLINDVEPALRYLDALKFPSGNFPSSIGRETDKLVHWCHGAPAMTMLFCLAHEVFGKDEYLNTALQCGEVIWNRGLLKKGYGICHGVAGNAYSFLSLYQYTKDNKHLHRACRFAQWCMDYGTHQSRVPDHPYSLFEGLAGTIYFLVDLQKPMNAKFPGYTL